MPKLFDIKLTGECKSLPDGFWSAVDVWINKPHVVNKRLCGANVTEVKDVDTEAVRCLLDSSHRDDLLVDSSHRDGLLVDSSHRDEVKDVNTEAVECLLDLDSSHRDELLSFLTGGGPSSAAKESVWSFSVRTFIPKVNCYGPNRQKEMVLKDFDRQQVTFVPFEEDPEGQVSQKKNNVYQIRLLLQACQEHSQEWLLEFHVLRPNEWFSDGVAYPKLPWLSRDLLPKLGRWATESKTSEFKSTLSLLPVEKYSFMYQQLKDQYKNMVKVWPEVTDPEKFVYEDVAIATYLLVLWAEERAEKDLTDKQSFVDLGCGNGLLVHILCNEGHPGKGIDVRKRKIWDMYGPQTILEEKAITPGDGFLFPAADWLIGNHSDELTPWIPIIAARSSYTCRYFVLPCCFFDFYGKYQRRQCKKSQYKEYIDFITEVSQASGFNTEEDCLRIPSTKRVCLVGKSRNYELSKESTAEDRRARYIQSRQTFSGITGQGSNVEGDGGSRHDDTVTDGTSANNWGAGFQPRDRVETVRNCASLPRDFIDGVVLQVANALLGLTTDGEEDTLNVWNQGGSLSVREVAELLQQDTLQVLKKECGGLQTLLKNNHQVFRVEGGMVYIRDWRSPLKKRNARADAKRKPSDPGALKTRYCWFYSHHRQGCPLQAQECAFAHGPDDLRPSTKPLKKMKNSVL